MMKNKKLGCRVKYTVLMIRAGKYDHPLTSGEQKFT
jgi:hypothetical protein